MSLINEALKKAQRQRSGESPSSPGMPGEFGPRAARGEPSGGLNSLLVRLALGVLLVFGIVLGGFYVAHLLTAPPDSPEPAAPLAATAPPPALMEVNRAPAVEVVRATPPPTTLPPEPAHTTAPTLPDSATTPAASAPPVETPAPTPTTPTKIIIPNTPTRMDGKAIAAIDALRVAGIRPSATDSKVLMNDRIYRVGDIVEHEFGIKLVEIRPNALTFENEAGIRYTRSF